MGFYCEFCRKRISILNSYCPHCGYGNVKYKIEGLNWDLDNRCRICYAPINKDGQCPHMDQHHRWKVYRWYYQAWYELKYGIQIISSKTKTIKVLPIIST
jgi:hypothetical protein